MNTQRLLRPDLGPPVVSAVSRRPARAPPAARGASGCRACRTSAARCVSIVLTVADSDCAIWRLVHPVGCHLRHAPLARRQRLDADRGPAPHALAGRQQLLVGLLARYPPAPQRRASSSASRSGARASARRPAWRRAIPRCMRAQRARATPSGVGAVRATAPASPRPRSRPVAIHQRPAARCRDLRAGAPQRSGSRGASRASSHARSRSPQAASAGAAEAPACSITLPPMPHRCLRSCSSTKSSAASRGRPCASRSSPRGDGSDISHGLSRIGPSVKPVRANSAAGRLDLAAAPRA